MIDTPSPYAGRLRALRKEMKAEALNGFLVPMADSYLNEYVPPSERRVEFLSGFTGSAALLIVLEEQTLFFTDSRYTLQAKNEVPEDLFMHFDIMQQDPFGWLVKNIKSDAVIGFDPRLHSTNQIDSIQKKLKGSSIAIRNVTKNLVDEVWTSRPSPISSPIIPHEIKYTGQTSNEKRIAIALDLKKKDIDAALLTDPSTVAWLFNIRGGDVPFTPLPLSRAILYNDGSADWFVSPEKIAEDLNQFLGDDIVIKNEADFLQSVQELGENHKHILIDPQETPYIYTDTIKAAGGDIKTGKDPCALPRACKNQTELDGMRAAHRRDGAAVVKLLAWLDDAIAKNHLTEYDVVQKLEEFRAQGSLHKGPSFSTIAAAGPNGAIVHYRPTETQNRLIDRDSFLLIDSGAQYLDGTTDITRTVPTGPLTTEMTDRYTRVLKGHIALASVVFPEGTTGAELDVLARQYLWKIGKDYGHGTGHGVGSYLNVHEGPQAISRYNKTELKAGMVLSNEPGFYKEHHYGIRHENLQYVAEQYDVTSDEQKMFGFTPLTLVPFDRRGISLDMLTETEKEWLNTYHTRVKSTLLPQLDDKQTKEWLERMTAAI